MKLKLHKLKPVLRGVAATTAALLTLSTVAYGIAKSPLAQGWVDGYFGINDRTIYNDWVEHVDSYTIPGSLEGYTYLKGKGYETTHGSADAYFDALKANAIKQGEEGFALLKNDNDALPLNKSAAGKKVALFGWNAYNLPSGHTGVVTNNSDKITLSAAFSEMEGITVNSSVTSADFTGGMKSASYGRYNHPEVFNENANWSFDANNETAIVVVGRGGGEGANYQADTPVVTYMKDKLDENGNRIPVLDENGDPVMSGGWRPQPVYEQEEVTEVVQAKDPLALSEAELNMIKYAKNHCKKVVLLIVSANAMELGEAVEKGGQYEVDAIGFCGIPNAYQYQGIANVLAGKANATGGLTDTYLYDNSYNPAVINMGQQQYADTATISAGGDLLGRTGNFTASSYKAENYIVEAEGIYVGYKYYETRYFDSYANPAYQATDTKGSSTGEAWNYADEVIFPFGQSLSYISYTQKITDVAINLSQNGDVRATIEVTNNGTVDGYFLTQLYVNRPYTEYDIEHKVEKSAVDFLNSAKVAVKAGKTEKVVITVPTRYLASWDSTALDGAGTYVLDGGDYLFTAAENSHAAANNFLAKLGHDTDETTEIGDVVVWDKLEEFDDKTFSESNGVEVRNQLKNADINYFYGEEKVTYLSRSKWADTFPKNYTNYVNDSGIKSEDKFTIAGAAKQDEWIRELQNAQYKVTPVEEESKWVNVAGVKPAGLAEGQSVWQWILSVAVSDPEAFSNINSEQWQAVAAAINLGSALNSPGQSGGTSKTFAEIGNPTSKQTESVSGYAQNITLADSSKRNIAVASNTLLGASFNPDLAYEWGLLEGEGGLWLQTQTDTPAMTVWGAGLNQHRTPYNGRNSEYMSEDPMLTNRVGEAQMRGAVEMGAICGPKHMGFNDQELNRQGNACYMTEQKARETDTRCYEGALRVDEGNGTGVMMSFARIGASNVTNSVGYINNIMRKEWGFTGIISTDFGQTNYHEVGAMIMASCNEYAGMGSGTEYTDPTEDTATINKATYITLGDARKDPAFANQARQTALYILYTQARTGSGLYVERIENNGEDIVVDAYDINHRDPVGVIKKAPWENIFISLEAVFGVLTGLSAIAWIASLVLPEKEDN